MSSFRTPGLSVVIILAMQVAVPAEEEKPKTLPKAKAAFAKADKSLNEAWAAVKKALSDSGFAELQVKQRDWMKFREDRAHGANRENNEPEAKQTAAYYEAAAELTESRASWLRGRIRNEADSLTGLWIDSFWRHARAGSGKDPAPVYDRSRPRPDPSHRINRRRRNVEHAARLV